MRRTILLVCLALFMISAGGCTSKEEKNETSDINTLKSFDLSERQAKDVYGYSNSVKLLMNSLSKINSHLSENDYEIPTSDSESIFTASKTLQDYYEALSNTRNEELNSFLTSKTERFGGVQSTLSNMQDYKRKMGINEAAIMYDNFEGYLSNALEDLNIPSTSQKSILDWYHSNNEYTDLFEKVHENRD